MRRCSPKNHVSRGRCHEKTWSQGQSQYHLRTAQPFLFAIEKYRKTLEQVVARKKIDVRFRHNLRAIDPEKKTVELDRIDIGDTVTLPFDLLHVTPPMSSPDVIKESPLANACGWVEVDPFTLQSPKFPNVFGVGDCSGLPTFKTGAAIRKQAPVVVANLISASSPSLLKQSTMDTLHAPSLQDTADSSWRNSTMKEHRERPSPSTNPKSDYRCIC